MVYAEGLPKEVCLSGHVMSVVFKDCDYYGSSFLAYGFVSAVQSDRIETSLQVEFLLDHLVCDHHLCVIIGIIGLWGAQNCKDSLFLLYFSLGVF